MADGYYQQETDIFDRLEGNGHDVTIKKSYHVTGSTDLTPYDLIIVTEYATGLSWSGIDNIDNSGKPMLIIEYWDFYYAYAFDMSWDSWGDYLGTNTVHNPDDNHSITEPFGDTLGIHTEPWAVLTDVHVSDLKSGVTPLIYSDQYLQNVTVAVDDAKKRVFSGICDTTKFTDEAWDLFDQIVDYLQGWVVFEDDFEDGDLEGWGLTRGDVQVSADAAYEGQYGLELSGENDMAGIGMAIDARGLSDLTIEYAVSTEGGAEDIFFVEVWSPSMDEPIVIDTVSGTTSWEKKTIALPREANNEEYLWVSLSYYPLTGGAGVIPVALIDTLRVLAMQPPVIPPLWFLDEEQSKKLLVPYTMYLKYKKGNGTIEKHTYSIDNPDSNRRLQLGECEWVNQAPPQGMISECCSQWTLKVDEWPDDLYEVGMIASTEQSICNEGTLDDHIMPMVAFRNTDYPTIGTGWFDHDSWLDPTGVYKYPVTKWGIDPEVWEDPYYSDYCSGCVDDIATCPNAKHWFSLWQPYGDIVGGGREVGNFSTGGPRNDPDVVYWVFDQPQSFPSFCRDIDSDDIDRWMVKFRLLKI
ncbi:MAG: hypothetical protein GY854_04125 [Deltaproteobacteria bacterium]|nr:hypothetical protein [Deltaproteobacteria bacterium]